MNSAAKLAQRQSAYAARNALENRDILSVKICQRFMQQVAYQQAQTVMWYLHCRSEVQTQAAVMQALNSGQRVVIPFCTLDDNGQHCLGLWWLESFAELVPGKWGILEPPISRWQEKAKLVSPQELDIILVPGVAFDRQGGRLGNGAGYYDRLLAEVRSDTLLSGVCFNAQLLDTVCMQEHDIYMHNVMTEIDTYFRSER